MKAIFLECGCCGYYHREEFCGDCRNDNERYTLSEIPGNSIIISIREQNLEEENDTTK